MYLYIFVKDAIKSKKNAIEQKRTLDDTFMKTIKPTTTSAAMRGSKLSNPMQPPTSSKPYFKQRCNNVNTIRQPISHTPAKENGYCSENPRNLQLRNQNAANNSLCSPLQNTPRQRKRMNSFALSNILFSCCLGRADTKGDDLQYTRQTRAAKLGDKGTATGNDEFNSNSSDSIRSLELSSHPLTRSFSRVPSSDSNFSLHLRPRYPREEKKSTVLQRNFFKMSNKTKSIKHNNRRNFKQNNVVVLRMFKQDSSETCSVISTRISKTLMEKDLSESMARSHIDAITRPFNKICGLGEVRLKMM